MIGSQDTWVQMPTVDLYDTQMMLAAVNAAKDMYNRSEERVKEFNEKYGDFTTPIVADQDWYNKYMTGVVYDTINDIYAKGGDPLRNSQDRLRMSMMLNRLPYGEAALKRLRAENAREYYKNMATLIANDKYDESFSRFLGEDPNQWATNSPGVTSPSVFKDLKASTDPWMKDLEPTDLGLDPTGMYRMIGITNDQIRGALSPYLSDFINTNRGKYFYSQAENELKNEGINKPTQAQIIDRLQDNIVTSQHPRTNIEYKADTYQQLKYNSELSNWVDAQKQARDNLLKHDLDGDGQIDASEKELAMALKQAEINSKLGLSATESWTNRQRSNIKEGMNVYADEVNKAKLGCSFNGARNQLISEGVKNPTTKQVNDRKRANQQKYHELINRSTNPNGVTDENLSYLNAYYNAYQTPVTGEDLKTALALAANLADPEAINDIQTNKKRLPIMFEADGNLNLTRQREAAYVGSSLTKWSPTSQLYEYLTKNGVEGFIPNNDVTVNRMPYGKYGVWDINFTGRFKKDDLAKFKGAGSEDFYNAIEAIGGRYVTSAGKVINAEDADKNGKLKWADIEYIDLPVSRTIDERAYTSWQIDDYHRRRVYGQSNAAKAAGKPNSE